MSFILYYLKIKEGVIHKDSSQFVTPKYPLLTLSNLNRWVRTNKKQADAKFIFQRVGSVVTVVTWEESYKCAHIGSWRWRYVRCYDDVYFKGRPWVLLQINILSRLVFKTTRSLYLQSWEHAWLMYYCLVRIVFEHGQVLLTSWGHKPRKLSVF